MKTRDEIISFIARNKNLFRKEFHITKIGIFGSYARVEVPEYLSEKFCILI
jgi:predicted nucleotidyltransferase